MTTQWLNNDWTVTVYSWIAFDARVTFWLQRVWSLPCACTHVALFARRLGHNHYAITNRIQCSKHARTRQWPGVLKPKSYSLVEGNRSLVTVDNCRQHGDYTVTVQSLCSYCAWKVTDGIGVLLCKCCLWIWAINCLLWSHTLSTNSPDTYSHFHNWLHNISRS